MTATAFAFDPILDPTDLDSQRGVAPVVPVVPRRPELRLIEGDGFRHIVPPAATPTATAVAPAPVSIEVYRRRRFLVLVAITALVLGIAWATGISVLSFGPASADVLTDAAPPVHVVLPGDTYAAIAADLGAADPVAAAELLRAANGGSELVVGQRVVIDPSALASG